MIPRIFIDRTGKVPRSASILGVVLVVAAVALFFASRRETSDDLILGGHLFDLDNSSIEGFLLTHDGAQFRFDRDTVENNHGYWTLRGATSDFLNQGAVAQFLVQLKEARGGRVLPGTEPEDRRYDFNGPESLRLTIFTSDGRRQSLAVGSSNPVTGHYYASGVGRPGCFPVTEVIQHRLASLPASLQLHVLLPRFERDLIQKIDLQYGQETHLLRRMDQRWWIRQPAKGSIALGSAAGAYHQQYDDRRMMDDNQVWLLGNDSAISRLLYETSEMVVNDIPATRWAQPRLQELELDPPWRRVTLHGAGINPDSTEASGDLLEIGFGPALDNDRVPALRRGNVLMTDAESLRSLGAPLGDFLDVGAVSFLVAASDSLRIWRSGELLIRGFRGEASEILDMSRKRPMVESWVTTFPTRDMRPGMTELAYQGLVRYMITNLDRLEILAVLPPVMDRRILSNEERVVMEIYTPQGNQKLEFGYLNADYLPHGSRSPVGTEDSMAPVALWRPQTGQLLQVPGHILVTLRNHASAMVRR